MLMLCNEKCYRQKFVARLWMNILACIINSSRVRIFYTHSGSAFSFKCLSFKRVCINHWNNLKMVIEWSAKKVDFHLEIAIKDFFLSILRFFCARGLNAHWMEKWNLMMMIFFFALFREREFCWWWWMRIL